MLGTHPSGIQPSGQGTIIHATAPTPIKKTIPKMKELIEKEGADIIPIMSYNSYNLDTKFGKAKDFIKEIEEITNNKIIHTIQGAEPIGPKKMTDIMVIAPCSRKYNGKTCF